MDISYLGHASFKIKSKSTTILTDPYDPKTVGLKFPKVSSDIVTVSHDHEDHNYLEGVKDIKKIISGPGEYEISEISIFGYQSFHDDKKGEVRGKNVIYSIEVEGYVLVHLGDLGHKLDQSTIDKLGIVDVLMIPVGGEYTIDAGVAVDVISSIEPKIIIPMHYNHTGLNQETFSKLTSVTEFLEKMSLPVENMDKFVLKGELSEEQKVVNLKILNG